MNGLFRPRARRAPALLTVSMADLAFLVIIFLMATMGLQRASQLEVQLPRAASGEPPTEMAAVTIGITKDGRFSIDGRAAERDRLAEQLKPKVTASREPAVVVAADRGVAWEEVIYAMDVARGLGVSHLELSVREPQP